MQITDTAISDVKILEPQVFGDARGFFYESYNAAKFADLIDRDVQFVQDNHSRSTKGVLRGLHYQLPPKAQGKLIRVIEGEIFDVAVDIRKSSDTFGHWVGIHLSAENKKLVWIPKGFAHGFLTLSDTAEVLYKASDFYAPDLERSIIWNDPQIGIDWPGGLDPLISGKDAVGIAFADHDGFA